MTANHGKVIAHALVDLACAVPAAHDAQEDEMTHPPLVRTAEPALAVDLDLPLDVDTADRAADEALGLKLGTTTREEIDNHTLRIRGQVALFAKAVREGGGVAARGSWLEADGLLHGGPSDDSLVFAALVYVRDLARLLRRLVSEHRSQLERCRAPLPSRTPQASLTRLSTSRQTYLVPSGLAPQHKAMPTVSE
ncbi:hypothetical protein ACIQVN_22480 [Streptomyces cyaneofuscatus]|uniref:hypothetical protein n=1 Tax=Streptomyces cyaneofuscatus TaxID=66883 RepID=UPI0037F2D253